MKLLSSKSCLLAVAVALAVSASTSARVRADDDPSIAAFGSLKKEVEQLRSDKEKKQFRHNYEKLVVRLQAVANTYKEGSKADDAAFVAAQLVEEMYYVSRLDADKAAAVDAFASCADRFPSSNLADDALVAAARLSDDKTRAKTYLDRVLATKDADMRDEAKKLAIALSIKPDDTPAQKTPAAAMMTTTTTSTAPPKDQMVMPSGTVMKSVDVLPEAPPSGTPSRKIIVIKHEKTATESVVTARLSGDVGMTKGEVPVAEGGPRRIFYDLAPAKLGQRNIQPIEVHDGVVARIRAGQYDTEVVRIVVELEGTGEPALHIQKKPTFEVRLTVPVEQPASASASAPVVAAIAAPIAAAPKSAPAGTTGAKDGGAKDSGAAKPDGPPVITAAAAAVKQKLEDGTPGGVSISQQMGLAVHRVVIDPGHGGNDIGATGPDGVKEKDITLQISKRVRDKLLAEMPDLEVVMTRDDDRTLSLQDRTNIANSAGADLFISIHCNASPLRRVRGVETYTLNITHDKYAMKLAARENAEMGEGSISDLEFILADLAMKSNVDDSVRLGRAVQQSVIKNLHKRWSDVPDLGLKHALFYVLMGTRMPSILVETSFVSNKQEEQRLASATYQDSIADGVVDGVRGFIDDRQAFYQAP